MKDLISVGKEFLGANVETHKALVNYYNWYCSPMVKPSRRYKMKLVDNWCAMFTSVVAHKAGYDADNFPIEVSVFYQVEIARERGQYSLDLDAIRVGDLLVYDWTGRGTFNHVGIVSSVGSSYLEVLEGNYNRTVGIRTVKRNSKSINGYIALGSGSIECETTRIEALAVKVLRGDMGNGATRKAVLGVDYEAVQGVVNKLI